MPRCVRASNTLLQNAERVLQTNSRKVYEGGDMKKIWRICIECKELYGCAKWDKIKDTEKYECVFCKSKCFRYCFLGL